MGYDYPEPGELGLHIPATLDQEKFRAGFHHGLRGRQLAHRDHLRQSFLEGFRSSKLFLREYRRRQGVLTMPMRARFRIKAVM